MSSSSLSVGIVGLPNVGKSTLFNALLKKQVALSANYPFATIEPNIGVVEVPDFRLQELAEMVASDTSPVDRRGWVNDLPPIIPAVVRFVDIAGLVKGAAQGEGLGNQFLSHIREVDVIVFVIRDFADENIVRSGSVEPKEDLEVLKSELLLKDLETIDKRLNSLSSELRSANSMDPRHKTLAVLEKAKELANSGKWIGENLDEEELSRIYDLQLLSVKKTIVVLNADESKVTKEPDEPKGGNAIRISAKMEEELASLSEEEQKEYLQELGIGESGLNILIRKAYETLDLATYFTAGPKEVRAWTIKKGMLAPACAGVIHTDFERGFIAADVCDWRVLADAGSWTDAKSKGLVKTIGKSEVVEDGMVVEFRFNI